MMGLADMLIKLELQYDTRAALEFCDHLGFLMTNKKQYFRELDELGRIVPPVAFRKKLHIEPGDALEFWMEGDTIVMKKVEPSCTFCGKKIDVITYKDSNICKTCLEELKKL